MLELAERRIDDVLAGRGQFLLVSGEAGVGKTRLMDAIGQLARERGFVAVWGDLAPQDHHVPAASALDLARSMAGVPTLADAGRRLLALRAATIDTGHVRRRQLVADMVDEIVGATSGPALFGFDDLQWADELSLEIIAELARRIREHRVLLCGGYRTGEAPLGAAVRDWRSRLITQRFAEEIRLRPLDEAETALVTTLVLDSGLPAPRDVAAAVYERTDGIPLHIEELLGALSADARANGYAIREATVPETIEDAVNARLSHRSPAAQAVARAGAVIGRCFVPDVLAGIMDVARDAVDEPLQELIDHGVLWPAGERGLIDFRHQLLRDAIYHSVPTGVRRRLHARAAEFGAALEGQSEIHSSVHFERAGLHRQAFEAALSGARDAARLSAHREAYELYGRVAANMPSDLGHVERGQIHEETAQEAASIEQHDAVIAAARAAEAAYRAAGEPVKALRARLSIEIVSRRDGCAASERLAAAEGSLAELDRLPEDADAHDVRAELETIRALALLDARRSHEARAAFERVRAIGVRLDDPTYAEVADWRLAVMEAFDGDPAAGIERIRAVAVAAEQGRREMTGVSAYRDGAVTAMLAMDYAAASGMIEAGLRYADSIEQSHCAHVMAATLSLLAWADGRWDEAARSAGQAMADRGCRRAAEMARWAIGYVALGRGDVTLASTELEAAWQFGLASETIDLTLPPLWGLTETALLAGDIVTAIARCVDAAERAGAVGERLVLVPFVVTGTRAYLADGRVADATAWLDDMTGRLAPIDAVAGPALAHARGLIALADGATGVAREALERAIAGWTAKTRVWEEAWARLDLAQSLVRSNRFAEALSAAVEVRATASRLGSQPLAERAEALARLARGRVAVEEPWRPLTSREFAVARLIGQGMTNAEIAAALGIAPKTASAHVEHILAKLGASRRAEIATWASHVDGAAAVAR